MPFQFPLASVLRVRQSVEKREERVLQRLQMEIARIQHQIDEVDLALSTTNKAREEALRQTLSASQLSVMLSEVQVVEARRVDLMDCLRGLQQQRASQYKVYLTAHQNHETILSLFQEQKNVYDQEQLRVEQRQLDDLFMARFHRE